MPRIIRGIAGRVAAIVIIGASCDAHLAGRSEDAEAAAFEVFGQDDGSGSAKAGAPIVNAATAAIAKLSLRIVRAPTTVNLLLTGGIMSVNVRMECS